MRYLIILLFTFYSVSGQKKFNYIMGYPVIYDSVNKLTYSFDSAAPSFLTSDIKLGKKTVAFSVVKDFNGKFKFRGKTKLDLELQNIGNIKTNALQIGSISECLNIDLFLGIEILQNKKLYFNFNKQLFTTLNNLSENNLNNFIEIPINYNSYDGFYYISTNINNDKIKFLLDLGFSGDIQLAKNVAGINKPYEIIDISYFGANSKHIKTIENYKDVKITFSNNVHIFNSVSKINDHKLNVMGIRFFKQFEEVIFDFEHKKIYFSKTKLILENSDNPIGFEIHNNKILISLINHKSEYYKSGLRVGDAITFDDQIFEEKI